MDDRGGNSENSSFESKEELFAALALPFDFVFAFVACNSEAVAVAVAVAAAAAAAAAVDVAVASSCPKAELSSDGDMMTYSRCRQRSDDDRDFYVRG